MSVLPANMVAIDPATPGGPEVLVPAERPVPAPKPGELLIRVAAAGVNRPDLLQRMGNYPPPPGAPSIPGLEVAGEIVAVGEGIDPKVIGGRCCALVSGGGYAQYVAVVAAHCLPVPKGLSMIEAAALPETFFTVWSNLFGRAYARPGDSVLVHGGTSGIGTTALALGKAFGLTMIVTCGDDGKCARARELGADLAVNYRSEDFVEAVLAFTGGKGVQVVIDMVGGDYVARNMKCLADEGRHVTIAVQRGPKAEIDLLALLRRRIVLTGSALRARDAGFKAAVAEELRQNVWPLLNQGRIRPVIDRVFPLEQAADAHRYLEAGNHVGKIVLEV